MSAAVESGPRPAMPIVTIREDGVFTSSRDVAVYFEKDHRTVLRSIDDIISQGHLRNFVEMFVATNIGNGATRDFRTYDMDRDGFMLLAMGFTGAKALQWKLRYIEAFKIMEAELIRLTALDGAYGDRRAFPSTDGGLLWGQPISKVNALANLMSTVLRSFGPEAARELYGREASMPVLDGCTVAVVAEERADLDAAGCLKHLLRLAAGNGRTVGALIDLARTDSVANGKLKRLGLDAMGVKGSAFVSVALRHSFLTEAFAETVWIGDWHSALLNLPGARLDRTRRRFGQEISMAVSVPYTAVTGAAGQTAH